MADALSRVRRYYPDIIANYLMPPLRGYLSRPTCRTGGVTFAKLGHGRLHRSVNRNYCRHNTMMSMTFAEWQHFAGMMNQKRRCQIQFELTAMLQNLVHELRRSAHLYIPAECVRQRLRLCTPAWAFAPLHHGGVPAPRPFPTVRRLDARQGRPALDQHSEEPCPPETPRVRASAPRHPRPALPAGPDGISPRRPGATVVTHGAIPPLRRHRLPVRRGNPLSPPQPTGPERNCTTSAPARSKTMRGAPVRPVYADTHPRERSRMDAGPSAPLERGRAPRGLKHQARHRPSSPATSSSPCPTN